MRSADEIRADLAVALSPQQDDDAAYLTWHDAVVNLLGDVEPLLAEVHELTEHCRVVEACADSEAVRGNEAVSCVEAVEALCRIYERCSEVDPTGEFRNRVVDLRAALAAALSDSGLSVAVTAPTTGDRKAQR